MTARGRCRGLRDTGPRAGRGSGTRTCGSPSRVPRGRRRRSGWRRRRRCRRSTSAASVVNPPADAPGDGQPVRIGEPRVGEVAGGGDAVLDVDHTPGLVEQPAVGAAEPGRAAVVDVDDGEAATRPVLHAERELGPGGRGRTAVDLDEERRTLARGRRRQPGSPARSRWRGRRGRRRSRTRSAGRPRSGRHRGRGRVGGGAPRATGPPTRPRRASRRTIDGSEANEATTAIGRAARRHEMVDRSEASCRGT